jgi:hypothetical protein
MLQVELVLAINLIPFEMILFKLLISIVLPKVEE